MFTFEKSAVYILISGLQSLQYKAKSESWFHLRQIHLQGGFVYVITWFRVQFGINKHEFNFSKTNKSVVFQKFTISAYLLQIAREKSCDYLLIIYTKIITTTTTFDSARVFSSFNWLAETDNYLCQIQTFSRPTLSKSFS